MLVYQENEERETEIGEGGKNGGVEPFGNCFN